MLAGPTAVGKSDVAMELAERMGGEIISVDSMQVYRGLDVGTAKPTAAECARVPHHLINVANLEGTFDVARYVAAAAVAAREIRERGNIPVYCGGTGFYFKALLCGVSQSLPANNELRRELESIPLAALLEELERSDPVSFARIDRRNPRRIIRALEVIRQTGRPFSAQQVDWNTVRGKTGQLIAFNRSPEDLRARIDRRVDRMFAGGLVDEVRGLVEAGLSGNRTAMQAIGYRQVVEYLNGARSLADTIELVKTRTWQFARRQLTWLRHQLDPEWWHLEEGKSPAAIADALVRQAV